MLQFSNDMRHIANRTNEVSSRKMAAVRHAEGHLPVQPTRRLTGGLILSLALLVGLLFATGCQTRRYPKSVTDMADQSGTNYSSTNLLTTTNSEDIILREGDVVKIDFPGSPSLTTTSALIRRDGIINLPFVGEVKAAGKTPEQLKETLQKLYASQVETKELLVQVVSSKFPVFVTGAVVRPGKLESDHPMTALEAIMESGGFDFTKANLKTVIVLRQQPNKELKSYVLNMKGVLNGTIAKQFYLKPFDIIYIKERFVWF
jgi:polysaccharide export outer membrane protein